MLTLCAVFQIVGFQIPTVVYKFRMASWSYMTCPTVGFLDAIKYPNILKLKCPVFICHSKARPFSSKMVRISAIFWCKIQRMAGFWMPFEMQTFDTLSNVKLDWKRQDFQRFCWFQVQARRGNDRAKCHSSPTSLLTHVYGPFGPAQPHEAACSHGRNHQRKGLVLRSQLTG